MLVARDITAQVQLETEREALRGRLAQSEKLASLGQFVAGIAHEMNNPLQGVLGHLELLIETSDAAKPVRPTLRRIYQEGDRAAKIVRNLLIFTGSQRMAAEMTDLGVRNTGTQTQVVATIRNSSRRYVRTRGTLVLYDQSGRNVREVPVPDVPLLPESEREVAISLVDPDKQLTVAPGDYKVEVRIDVGLPALLVGETSLKVLK